MSFVCWNFARCFENFNGMFIEQKLALIEDNIISLMQIAVAS